MMYHIYGSREQHEILTRLDEKLENLIPNWHCSVVVFSHEQGQNILGIQVMHREYARGFITNYVIGAEAFWDDEFMETVHLHIQKHIQALFDIIRVNNERTL